MLKHADEHGLEQASPCAGWSVLDVARHVEITPRVLADGLEAPALGAVRTSSPLPRSADRTDVTDGLSAGAVRLRRALERMEEADLEVQLAGPVGPMQCRKALQLAVTEIALHRCDIALGLRLEPELSDATATTMLDVIQAWLLLLAASDPRPAQPLCYQFTNGTSSWWFRFDGDTWDSTECAADSTNVCRATAQRSRLVLALTGRSQIEQTATNTTDIETLRQFKSYLPGP
ncbi:MAG: maleylpyruvate isomerase family mycothiol-dependent enzyme [Actinomycetota bacterium]